MGEEWENQNNLLEVRLLLFPRMFHWKQQGALTNSYQWEKFPKTHDKTQTHFHTHFHTDYPTTRCKFGNCDTRPTLAETLLGVWHESLMYACFLTRRLDHLHVPCTYFPITRGIDQHTCGMHIFSTMHMCRIIEALMYQALVLKWRRSSSPCDPIIKMAESLPDSCHTSCVTKKCPT